MLEVRRQTPPAIGRCTGCGRSIEWCTTPAGKRMPVNHPLVFDEVHARLDGSEVTFVHSDRTHWATCPERERFSAKQRGGFSRERRR